MEVDSDSEQPSGSGTVSKDKKRCFPPSYQTLTEFPWSCKKDNVTMFPCFFSPDLRSRSGMLWRSGLGTLLWTTVPSAGFVENFPHFSAKIQTRDILKLAVLNLLFSQ